MRTLFVCRGNLSRSRVAENIFRVLAWNVDRHGDHDVRSAGTKADPGGHQITTRDVEWADVICVMEPEQAAYVRRRWPAQARKIRVLGIPDVYEADDKTLQDRLTDVVRTLLADESPERWTMDSSPAAERPAKPDGSRWRGLAPMSRAASGVVGLALLAAIGGYLASSRSAPEQPVSSAVTTSGATLPIAPAATPGAGVPANHDAESDQAGAGDGTIPGPVDQVGPFRPTSVEPVETPTVASERPSPPTTKALAIPLPPPPRVRLQPEPSRVPVALPQPAPRADVMVDGRSGTASPADSPGAAPGTAATRPALADGVGRDGGPRADIDAPDPAAIIDWVLREYPARRQ